MIKSEVKTERERGNLDEPKSAGAGGDAPHSDRFYIGGLRPRKLRETWRCRCDSPCHFQISICKNAESSKPQPYQVNSNFDFQQNLAAAFEVTLTFIGSVLTQLSCFSNIKLHIFFLFLFFFLLFCFLFQLGNYKNKILKIL